MKKILCLVILATSFTACQKIKNLANITFDVPYSQTVTVPSVPGYTYGIALPAGGIGLPFPATTVATNASQYFNQYHASSKNIVSAYLSNLNMQIIAPPNQYFDFLDSIQLFISTETQPEVLVAYQYNISKWMKQISLVIVPNVNLKNYFVQDSITVRLNAHINAIPASGTQVQISGKFSVTANPL